MRFKETYVLIAPYQQSAFDAISYPGPTLDVNSAHAIHCFLQDLSKEAELRLINRQNLDAAILEKSNID